MAKKIALVFGASGQDGTLLRNSLLKKGYYVIGTTRTINEIHTKNIHLLSNMIKLNDNGCQLSYVPNPTRKKERVDMIIIRDLFDINSPDIVGLISSDGDFVPYLKKLEDKGIEVFAITNNYRYDKYISDIIKWENICK